MGDQLRKCPACDSTNVIPIVYGEPDSYLALEADETKVLLGRLRNHAKFTRISLPQLRE